MTMVFGVLRAHQVARSPRGARCLQVPQPSFSTLAEKRLGVLDPRRCMPSYQTENFASCVTKPTDSFSVPLASRPAGTTNCSPSGHPPAPEPRERTGVMRTYKNRG